MISATLRIPLLRAHLDLWDPETIGEGKVSDEDEEDEEKEDQEGERLRAFLDFTCLDFCAFLQQDVPPGSYCA